MIDQNFQTYLNIPLKLEEFSWDSFIYMANLLPIMAFQQSEEFETCIENWWFKSYKKLTIFYVLKLFSG